MATVYGSYISSAFRSRADISTSQTNIDFTISVTGYCQMADYYHDSGENFFRKIVIGSDTPNTYVTASTAYFSGGGTYGVGSSSRKYNRTHSAQSIEVGVAIHNDGVYTGWSTADSYAKTTVTVPAKPSYAVTYNANGGSSTPSSQTQWYGESLTLASAISRSNASATGYKVTYDANGGSCSTASATAARTTKYTFSKWNTKSDGSGTAYAAGASYTGNSALALYATWTSSTTTAAVTLPTPTRSGYTFNGWYNGSTKAGNAGASFTPSGNVTLTASWTQNTWTVSYAANGGSSTPASQTKLYGQALTLRPAISRSNATATYTVSYSANYTGGTNPSSGTATKTTKYSFNGWKDTNGTVYAASGSYTTNAATTMTAQWTSSASTTSVTLPTPTRTGYTFGGWYKESSCTNKVGNGGASYTPTASVTLYAHWTVITYTVAYNANNGSGAPSSQTKNYGVNLTLSSTKPTRTGYTFSGWNTKADGSGTSYAAGANYTANAAATLYAQWTIITYTVSYNANGGSGAPSSQTKTYGKTLTLSSTNPTRSGYEFWHWNTKSDNSGTTYAAGANYTANAAATLYAIWNPIISYNANGGTGAPASQTKTYGTDLTLSSTIPTRTNLTFAGWGTSSTATTVAYVAGGKYTSNSAATLYAIWKYTVNFNGNGNGVNPASQTAVYGHNVTIAGYPTRSGYRFLGWNSAQDGTGTHYAPGTSVAVNENCTLYAQWRKVTVSSVKVTRNVQAIGFTSTWSCSSTVGGTVTVTAQYSLDDGENWHDCTLTGDATKTKVAGTDLSGTVSWDSTADEDVAVRVMVTASFTDTYSSTSISGGHVETAQRGGTIPKEFRLFDALHGGTGLAIGAIATLANTFEVALNSIFRAGLRLRSSNVDRDGTAPSSDTWSDSELSFQDMDGERVGFVNVQHHTDGGVSLSIAGEAEATDGTDVYTTLKLIVNRDKTGHAELNKRLIVNGSVTATSNAIINTSSNIDRDGENPSANAWGSYIVMRDKDNEDVAYIQAIQTPDGRMGMNLHVINEAIGGGDTYANWFRLFVDRGGNFTYAVRDAAAFRNGINAAGVADQSTQNVGFGRGTGTLQHWTIGCNANTSNTTYGGHRSSLILYNNLLRFYDTTGDETIWDAYTTKNKPTPAAIGAVSTTTYETVTSDSTGTGVVTAKSGFTVNTAGGLNRAYKRNGVATIYLGFKTTNALNAGGSYNIGTLNSGWRPNAIAGLWASGTRYGINASTQANGEIYMTPTVAIPAGTTFYLSGTFVQA